MVVGLTLYNGSVIAELLRSGVKQLPRGQGEAGLAIGLTPTQTLIRILLPQAFTAMMPSMLSQFVVILKDTALGYIISYPELLASARRIGSGDGNVLQTPDSGGGDLRDGELRADRGSNRHYGSFGFTNLS